jgi:hypothetical protein
MGAFNAFFFDHGSEGVEPLARFLRVVVRQGIRHGRFLRERPAGSLFWLLASVVCRRYISVFRDNRVANAAGLSRQHYIGSISILSIGFLNIKKT